MNMTWSLGKHMMRISRRSSNANTAVDDESDTDVYLVRFTALLFHKLLEMKVQSGSTYSICCTSL